MTDKEEDDFEALVLEAHRRGVAQAIDLSERTGVPLVYQENGIIKRVKPKYKYIRVPVDPDEDEENNP